MNVRFVMFVYAKVIARVPAKQIGANYNEWLDYTAIYVKSGEWWAATVEEIPGVNTQGRTLEEARANLQDALRLVLDALRKDLHELVEGEQVVKEIIHLKAS